MPKSQLATPKYQASRNPQEVGVADVSHWHVKFEFARQTELLRAKDRASVSPIIRLVR